MSRWAEFFLGVIAAATLATAIVQIGLIVAAARMVRRFADLVEEVRREMRPIFAHLDAIGRDASRATSLAAARVEQLDRAVGDLLARSEQVVGAMQAGLSAPVREGKALMSGLWAAFAAVRAMRGNSGKRRGDEEDALFI